MSVKTKAAICIYAVSNFSSYVHVQSTFIINRFMMSSVFATNKIIIVVFYKLGVDSALENSSRTEAAPAQIAVLTLRAGV